MRRRVFLLLMVLLILSGLGMPQAHAAPPNDGTAHVVQAGETLSGIAMRYGITTALLIRANGIANPNWIYAGQRLAIPTGGSTGEMAGNAYHTVQQGENLYMIAVRYGVSVQALIQTNDIANPNLVYVGQRLRIPGRESTEGRTHIVRRGETLSSIALRYGVPLSALAWANGLNNTNLIYIKQQLHIPANGALSVPGSQSTSASKLIEVNIPAQRMTVWENVQVKWHWVCSTGEPGRPTSPGRWSVINKIPNAYSRYYDLQMPWWLGIYWAGSLQNGIHALPILSNGQTLWAGHLGRRVSYGCIILDTADARALYQWADIGTPVFIHY